MDLSGGLYTLPPEALSILRFFAISETEAAHTDVIIEGAGLSDRGFGKGIRRLVTRNYLTLSGDQVYRLTDLGRRSIRELVEDEQFTDDDGYDIAELDDEPRFVRRRLVLVTSGVLLAEREMPIIVGFDQPASEDRLERSSDILLRLSVINGEPQRSQEVPLQLLNSAVQHTFKITPGAFTEARLRAEVIQLRDSDEVEFCGGLYVDLRVQRVAAEDDLAPNAYGIDVLLREV